MAEARTMRLNKVLREFNISLDRAVEFLKEHGHEIDARPTTKISGEVYDVLFDEFQTDKSKKRESKEVGEEKRKEKERLRLEREKEQEEKERKAEVVRGKASLDGPKQVGKIDLNKKPEAKEETPEPVKEPVKETPKEEAKPEPKKEVEVVRAGAKLSGTKQVGKIDLDAPKKPVAKKEAPKKVEPKKEEPKKETPKVVAKEAPKKEEAPKQEAVKEETKDAPEASKDDNRVTTNYKKLDGPNFTGEKIDLSQFKKPAKKKDDKKTSDNSPKKRRRRISKDTRPSSRGGANKGGNNRRGGGKRQIVKEEPTEAEVQKQVRETLEKLQGKSNKGKGAKYRRDKRDQHRTKSEEDLAQQEIENKTLKVTEFVTVSEVAIMMDVPVTKVISACMTLGMMVTMNQRLDAETLSIVADEFGYEVDFVSAEEEESIEEFVDAPEDLVHRAPIVTVMGHVDHGKTSLLDYIREENVIAGESGGITQHIGAYAVELESGQKISFLDTPGHEAFTAMRARGAQVTDIAIIVIAADDDVMPQTKEAISHAQAAGVPIIFAINKVDLPTSNPEKIKEKLASMNLLVEDWGGKIQSHDISAKKGTGVKELLEKVLLEAEILELQANPTRLAQGTVVEAFLDKGRGYVSTILVQTGTLKIGDYVLAGTNSGKVKAMQDERGHIVKEAGPSTPVSILGLDGAPQAGDKFVVMEDEREAKDIASKRTQLQREQSVRTQRHITLDEIGRRIALGDFKELNIILKGDVDGSVEALTDSFQKLSTEEIQVNILHKGVGAITESDVLLASASDAIIIGFNVRPAGNARQVADQEEIDIRTYSIIYDAINDLKDAMEGMLSPVMKEEITGTAEIRETFKISKVGTIAGCMVTTGKIYRNSGIRLIRDGVVVFTGELDSLKRFKDDVKEVSKGYDCGLQVKNYNDIKEGDIVEAYQEVAVKKKLK
ncbi:translation initiation factor IF-2 [Croceibacter atlanticus]|jgi:translation initiation factor IF-2|uniref:Translation initiation factor IF-2 n=1 Tax=Croceibacter atlanticus (strain ATCC BAA-628 / JCM 21780 / CIP 108009 / IAM 15332 / KCTC 12090 / HTCC2559) TaxID=216432 RepID=A3U539_CROAH|nr:translation initiation factor IF-2 [Croceibacter atlanticus]EAP87356.1 putative translation initiation factor [Croceibacter atlanticus HTCC2559]MBW4970410.1 translation initiation factor IF-2 [Croceibacter atlanticus]WSP34963.1 translation initiation factor IF-2 [Croceibacter atlanticus]|tara:strand:+ start:889 stop:3720 length:2832 start_codon:yes stop_codon:yes gene_type:complete